MKRIFDRGSVLYLCTGLALLAVVVAARAPRVSAQQSIPDAWSGVYSAEQATRGEALYAQMCVVCHGQDLTGTERAPGVAGPGLVVRWGERPLGELLDYIQLQMPLHSPDGLTRHQNADILAFMLQRSGGTAGAEDLWIDGVGDRPAPVPRSADYGKVATPSTRRASAFYTEAQATRGRLAFNRNCAYCHTVDPTLSTPEDLARPLPSTFGGHFIERVVNERVVYPHVLALYSKLLSMPAHNTRSITEQQRVDIVSYILQANGLPAGDEEIPVDTASMRLMMLNEPGFEPIFSGKDFAGWNIVLGGFPYCRDEPGGCAKDEPMDVLRIEDQTIVCECHVHGYFYTDKKYKDFTLRFETKFERPHELAPEDDEELFSGGSGYLLFMDFNAGSFPRMLEVEGRHRDFLEFVHPRGDGRMGELDLEAKRRVIRPLGEWNTVEIGVNDGDMYAELNGVLIASVKRSDYNFADYDYPGHIGFQVQGAKMYWRNIRIRPE